MRGRTDLAVEMKEDIQAEEPVRGVHVLTKNNGDTDIKEVRIVVENEEGAMCLGKPVGTYITLESEQLRRQDKRRVIRVVTGDALEQGTVLSFGAARMTVRELRTRVAQSREGTRAHMEKLQSAKRHELTGRLPQDIADALEVMRRS